MISKNWKAEKISLSIVVISIASRSTAHAEGFNSENYTPALDAHSGILWESPQTLPRNSFLFGNTLSYAVRPLEFGDGASERLQITDNLLVNHIGFAYGVTNWLQIGGNFPIALLASPNSSDGYLRSVQSRNRSTFYPGDLSLSIKTSFSALTSKFFDAALIGSMVFPTGSREAILTDDSIKFSVEMPFSVPIFKNKGEIFFSPGYSVWGSQDRIYAYPTDSSLALKLLQKSNSLLLNAGGRYWVRGTSREISSGSLALDAGVRGDFSGSKITTNSTASPLEWSSGAAYFVTPSLSVHGAFGTGIGRGVGAPLSRVVAGLRFAALPPTIVLEDETPPIMLSTSAYSEKELAALMEQARAEPVPPALGDDDAFLRLKVNGQVFDIGRIHFDYNSAKLSSQAKLTVGQLFRELKRIDPYSIKIDGHTDSIGTYKYNLFLSKLRADSVRSELAHLGMEASIIETEGYSYKFPVASNATKNGRIQNRRIEVSVNGESFRKTYYSPEEENMLKEWIAPGGKKPRNE